MIARCFVWIRSGDAVYYYAGLTREQALVELSAFSKFGVEGLEIVAGPGLFESEDDYMDLVRRIVEADEEGGWYEKNFRISALPRTNRPAFWLKLSD